MSTLKVQTFSDIVEAIREAIGVQEADSNAMNKIRRMVNMYYIDEVVPFKTDWPWLQKSVDVIHKAYYNTGTCTVTPDSTTVTLGTTPSSSLGSFKNYRFSVDGSNKVYTISAHTAGTTAITLTNNFQEDLNTTANFRIWRDSFDLPTDAKTTLEIVHSENIKPLDTIGLKEIRKYEAAQPKREGFPTCYNVGNFYDPSASDGESESDRYRQVRIYPAITKTPITLHIDYTLEAVELTDDDDEPIIPIGDRSVLVYGAGALAWSLLQRNEEMSAKWQAMADRKLARMAGDKDEGHDSPTIAPSSKYINSIRRGGLRRRYGVAAGGTSSVTLPTYLKNVTIEGATITANVTVATGVTIGGVDLSTLASQLTPTSVTLVDNSSGEVVEAWDDATYDVIHIDYSLSRGNAIVEVGSLKIASVGGAASIAQGFITSIGSSGVTFTADTSGSDLRLLYTTTSTGTDATMKYVVKKWLA